MLLKSSFRAIETEYIQPEKYEDAIRPDSLVYKYTPENVDSDKMIYAPSCS